LRVLFVCDPSQELVPRLGEPLGPRRAMLRRRERTEIAERRLGRLKLSPASAQFEGLRRRHLHEPGTQGLDARQVLLLERRAALLGLLPSPLQTFCCGGEAALEQLDLAPRRPQTLARSPPAPPGRPPPPARGRSRPR